MPIDKWLSMPATRTTVASNCFFFVFFVFFFFAVPLRSSISPNFSSSDQSRPCFTAMGATYKKIWKLLCEKVGVHYRSPSYRNKDTESFKNGGKRSFFRAFDADFFSNTEMDEVLKGAEELNLPVIRANRKLVASENGGLHNPSPLVFSSNWANERFLHKSRRFCYPPVSGVKRPKNEEDIAFMSVLELGELIKTKQITSQELVGIFLKRLKRYDYVLQAVVSFTEDLAYKQAKEADELFARGVYLGPLHGIPYGLKDIISVPGYKTTWGSKSFKEQVIDVEAWVYQQLKSAGAVLVTKLVTGSLAYDDIWFGGRTRNPWNIEEFTTGSSAGPAACTSAGLVPFAIGSETAGSMTYPASRCGVTALRPTFGTVGRSGVMSISESLVVATSPFFF